MSAASTMASLRTENVKPQKVKHVVISRSALYHADGLFVKAASKLRCEPTRRREFLGTPASMPSLSLAGPS
jgi:hypothetical protein